MTVTVATLGHNELLLLTSDRPDLQSQSTLPQVTPAFSFIGDEVARKDSGGVLAYACKKASFAFLMRTDFKPF